MAEAKPGHKYPGSYAQANGKLEKYKHMKTRFTAIITFFIFSFFYGCGQKSGNEEPPKPPRGFMNESFLKMAYSVGLLDLINTNPEVPGNIDVYKDITYKSIDTVQLKLDIYRKKDIKKPTPVLVFIHGGAWKKGKRQDYLPYLVDYAKKGYITVTISYRLSPVATFPAAVEDVKCAIRWIRKNAALYSMDPENIAVIGGSAGGHLALMLGYTKDGQFTGDCPDSLSSRVQAVVDFYGPVDLTTPYARSASSVIKFLGTTYDEDPGIFRDASPKSYISPGDPPTLIFQGTIDSLVPYSQSDSLDVWLGRAGVPHEYHKLKGWPHTMDMAKKVNQYCQYYMDRFFGKYLQKTDPEEPGEKLP